MLQESDINVPWLALNVTGQWCLLALLATYAFVQHLPQRNNPYLVNFILTNFLATIPPTVLLYTGYQFRDVPAKLCLAQAVLVDGLAPMFGVAQVILVFDTWSELRFLSIHKKHISRITFLKCVFLIAPYFVVGFWTFASYGAALGDSANFTHTGPVGFVYCRNAGGASDASHKYVGVFMGILAIIQVILELWVGWMIYAYPSKVHEDPTTWRTNIRFAVRILIFSLLQFIQVFLSILDNPLQSFPLKVAYELFLSMIPLAIFLAFGTQKNIFRAWKSGILRVYQFVTRKEPEESEQLDGLQPLGYPTSYWGDVPRRKFGSFDASPLNTDFGFVEKGLPAKENPKAWLCLRRK